MSCRRAEAELGRPVRGSASWKCSGSGSGKSVVYSSVVLGRLPEVCFSYSDTWETVALTSSVVIRTKSDNVYGNVCWTAIINMSLRLQLHAWILSHFSHVWLHDPMDHSLPGSSDHRILQEKMLEWVAMLSCRGSFQPRDQTRVSYASCRGRRVHFH